MVNRVALFVSGDLSFYQTDFDMFVGVDRACLFLLQKNLPLDLAVGDFDSVTAKERQLIFDKSKKVLTASSHKNDTDTEMALKTIWGENQTAEVTVFGAFGGRIDHELANLFLVSDPDLKPYMTQLTLKNESNIITYYPKGWHDIYPIDRMTYVSFLTVGDGKLQIDDAKYPLNETNYFKKKIYTSNAFLNKPIKLWVEKDYVIALQTKDKN